ncbi:RebB family R body protein, partial [Burkholderia sp. Ac-20345]|uniref:RebB family R body protein n=1 Tax=Burkholderia sp. Ac-20345 TaxID=2703891 RepID=UPI001F11A4C4
MPEQVSPAVTDAVTQANVKVVGEAPAVALGTLMQSNSHASAILLHNALDLAARPLGGFEAATAGFTLFAAPLSRVLDVELSALEAQG